jgi:hypothetical protein
MKFDVQDVRALCIFIGGGGPEPSSQMEHCSKRRYFVFLEWFCNCWKFFPWTIARGPGTPLATPLSELYFVSNGK